MGCLLGGGIVILPIVFAWFTLKKGYSPLVRGLSFGWLALTLLITALQPPPAERQDPAVSAPTSSQTSERPQVAPSAEPEAPPAFIKESCYELARVFGPSSKLSELQKDEKWKQFKGKPFEWKLQVVEVSAGLLGGYTVQFKCGTRSDSLIQDLQMQYPADAKSLVMQYEKDSVYKVRGRLARTGTLLGMSADPLP